MSTTPPNTDYKSTAIWAWERATEHAAKYGALSPLLLAIQEAIHAITGNDSDARDQHAINKFARRIAKRGDEHFQGCPALDYCNQWSGEWHITNDDLRIWSIFSMWLSRSNGDSDFAAMTFQRIRKALSVKRLFQAYQRYCQTGLTKAHCGLLANLKWQMDMERGDWISLYVEGKRPFGNSSIAYDIYEHAGWPMDWPADDGMSPGQEEAAWELFDELVFATPDAAKLAMKSINQPA